MKYFSMQKLDDDIEQRHVEAERDRRAFLGPKRKLILEFIDGTLAEEKLWEACDGRSDDP
jgi:hypothetical protein